MASLDFLRRRISNLLGKAYDGKRDYYEVFGYPKTLTFEHFEGKYLRQDIASRVVDAPVNATWRRTPKVFDDDGVDGEFSQSWIKLVQDRKVFNHLARADRLSGIGQYATLLLGFDDGGASSSPVKGGTDRKLLYMQPYNQPHSEIKAFETSTSSPRFGLPVMYTMNKDRGIDEASIVKRVSQIVKPFDAHHTRVLHVAEISLEDNVYGIPRMMNVYNLLEDLQKVVGGTAETFWLTSNRGLHADVDKEMEMDKDDEEALSDEIQDYVHEVSRVIRTRGVSVKGLGTEVADPSKSFQVLIGLISGARGIPVRILLGSEQGALSSTQDRANWANRVEERQLSHAEPNILRPFIDRMVIAGVMKAPNGDIIVEWQDPFAPSPLERAQTMAQTARAATNLGKTLALGELSPITENEARSILGFKGNKEGEGEGGGSSSNEGEERTPTTDNPNTPGEVNGPEGTGTNAIRA